MSYQRWGGKERIPKAQWIAMGGLSNPDLFRRHNGRCWEYYIDRRK